MSHPNVSIYKTLAYVSYWPLTSTALQLDILPALFSARQVYSPASSGRDSFTTNVTSSPLKEGCPKLATLPVNSTKKTPKNKHTNCESFAAAPMETPWSVRVFVLTVVQPGHSDGLTSCDGPLQYDVTSLVHDAVPQRFRKNWWIRVSIIYERNTNACRISRAALWPLTHFLKLEFTPTRSVNCSHPCFSFAFLSC